MNLLLVWFGKILSKLLNLFNLGSGATWPGHIALSLNKDFIKELLQNTKTNIILVAGTNGKTTTSQLIETILAENGRKVFRNTSGANLLNGIASSIILNSNIFGRLNYDFTIFEVDESTLPLALKEITPSYLILLNLFRDQLDRYGEVNTVANKWKKAIDTLPKRTKIILNANDPQIAFLGIERDSIYFGLEDKGVKIVPSNADSVFCPKCSSSLTFSDIYFSHIGKWACSKCGFKMPKIHVSNFSFYPATGIYNKSNIHASVLLGQEIGLSMSEIEQGLTKFKPAFGRQEVIEKNGKKIKIYLSKNPTSFNESLRTMGKVKKLLLILNDNIPDGKDVSWIWDVDFENLLLASNVIVSGQRAYDLGLRLKYANFNKFKVVEDVKKAVNYSLRGEEMLYILPTYSAMLEVRKILTGKKIL